MSNILLLNQSFVSVGLTAMTYTIPVTGQYNVSFSTTVPQAAATGDGSGSGTGLGSGAGGGTLGGFSLGGGGLGDGAVGQGFGDDLAGYPQPLAAGSNETSGAVVSSSLVVVVNKNGSPVYTAPALAAGQSALQFKFDLMCAATDIITVVLSSSAPVDNALNNIKSIVSIGQGL